MAHRAWAATRDVLRAPARSARTENDRDEVNTLLATLTRFGADHSQARLPEVARWLAQPARHG